MNKDILTIMQERVPTFSKGQKRLASYIIDNYDKAAFMTASILGKTVGVSESTVVRFAIELGFDGYPSMQKSLQEAVINRLTSAHRFEIANNQIDEQDVVSTVLDADANSLRQTAETINRIDFAAAVHAILKAKRIYLIGVRSAAVLANFAGYYFNYMFSDIHTITTSGGEEMFEKLVNLETGDVVLAFGFSQFSSATIKGMQYCRSVGATVIAVTNSYSSPMAQCCDYLLVAKSGMVSFADSLVAPLSIINALLIALASSKEIEIKKTFDTLERAWEEYYIFEKQVNKLCY